MQRFVNLPPQIPQQNYAIAQHPQDDLASVPWQPPVHSPISPEVCWQLAYKEALQGAGSTLTNPLVGAVLVDRKHHFLAAAAHLRYGEAHAEVNLLAKIEALGLASYLVGATLYCTLEPCAHSGKTPSCAKLLASLPLKSVVCAESDPNPLVNGAGFAILAAAGIEIRIEAGFAAVARGLIAPFCWYLSRRTPFVAAKVACSADGAIGRLGGQRLWVTNARARLYGHWLRLLYDGVAVGAMTVIADNPRLDVRHPGFPGARSPWRVVLDPGGRALQARPLSTQNLLSHAPAKVLWVVSPQGQASLSGGVQKDLEALGAQLVVAPWRQSDGAFDLEYLQGFLGQMGVSSLLLEGGRHVWAHFFNAKLVQKLYLFESPCLFGGQDRLHWAEYLAASNGLTLRTMIGCPLEDNWLWESEAVYQVSSTPPMHPSNLQ